MTTKEEILEVIKGMSVLELSDLVKSLEDEFGISAAAPVAVAAASAASPRRGRRGRRSRRRGAVRVRNNAAGNRSQQD